jgi:hypothetical protein
MTVNTITTAPQAARSRTCPLCDTPAGRPCQPKPSGDHLARYLDAYTAGHLTRAYMARVLGELVVIDGCAVITGSVAEPEPRCSDCGHGRTDHLTRAPSRPEPYYCAACGCLQFRAAGLQLLAAPHWVTYAPDPVWGGYFADLRDGDGRLVETGLGATQAEALADLVRRLGGAR